MKQSREQRAESRELDLIVNAQVSMLNECKNAKWINPLRGRIDHSLQIEHCQLNITAPIRGAQ